MSGRPCPGSGALRVLDTHNTWFSPGRGLKNPDAGLRKEPEALGRQGCSSSREAYGLCPRKEPVLETKHQPDKPWRGQAPRVVLAPCPWGLGRPACPGPALRSHPGVTRLVPGPQDGDASGRGPGSPKSTESGGAEENPGGQGPRRESVRGRGGASDGVPAERPREGRETRGDAHQNGRFSAAASRCGWVLDFTAHR